eukprot:11455893-Prorocentrum_lima.AAC.1
MNELDQIHAATESAILAKLEKKNLDIERPQQVEQRLIQTVQNTEDWLCLNMEELLNWLKIQ